MPPHLQQRQQPKRSASPFGLISRSVSDTTHSGRSTGSAAKQILLQTIESRNNATTKPKPLPRTNGIVSISSNNSSATGSSSPDHKYHPPHHQPQHSNVSFTSHYSVDAGKHGFLSHSPPPSPPPRLHSFSNGDDDSAAGGAGIGGGDANSVVSNGSLVFKYLPGQETPPAEYALPVSILKVYGDSLVDEIDHHHLMNSSSKDIIPPVRRKVLDEFLLKGNENQQRQEESNTTTASSMISSSRSELPLPPPITILEDTTTTSGALPSLREEQHRILPYHERKRLSELLVEKEKQRRQKKNAATTANVRNQQQANSKTNGGMVPSASENTPLNGVTSGGYGGTTPLMASNNNNGNNDVEHGGGNDNVANHVIHPKDTKEWFGQLVSIITGKSAFNINDAGENKDPKQTYRDQAAAFLKKTESERMKIKELSSAKQKNLDRSWAKRSSISAALDSIPSCSGEEEEEVETDDDDDNDTNETYSSSEEEEDEEYGSYYFDNRKGGGTNPSATMASGLNATPKVWSYGEPPITIDRSNSNASLMKKLAAPKKHHHMSEHDLKMRRDRLLQEEYEYRLRALQREHANLSKKFRIFVLVTVAIIFTGALTFAFVVCVRMLMSIK